MAPGHVNTPPSVRPAQYMRQAGRPVEQRLSRGAHGAWGFVVAHPPVTQGIYYVLAGLWPWIHLTSFLAVTGDKADLWLGQTVGALIVAIGAALCVAAHRPQEAWATTAPPRAGAP